jgi:predicted HicB family RNase H-like nuclease
MNIESYQYRVSFSDEDQLYVSSVAEFPYLSADGATPEEALVELKGVVEEAVDILSSEGKDIPVPLSQREYKGNISLRLSPEIHGLVVARARDEGCSLNQFLTSLIERNIYADKIERTVKALEQVTADLEINQSMRELSTQAPFGITPPWNFWVATNAGKSNAGALVANEPYCDVENSLVRVI